MGYVKFEARSLGDARWLDATCDAFVVHVFALSYCNEQATDGHIADKVARRLSCPVEPAHLEAAWSNLVELGVWVREGDGYTCLTFLAHGIAAEEQERTRSKWAADKRRRRLHAIGNHSLCTRDSRCALSTGGQSNTSTSGQVDDSTRLDSTRSDSTPSGVEPGGGRGRRSPAPARPQAACQLHAVQHDLGRPCPSCAADAKAGLVAVGLV